MSYTGQCAGGPYDGQVLVSEGKSYAVAYETLPPLSTMMEEPPDVLLEIKFGTYRYALGRWVWRRDAAYPRDAA